ncbi:UvrD-helicase domain-containing protein [Tepidibacter thalassicus]|uniref:Superfamily I DNA or RNA helicase n=1 Tax=Tepidibacter thalassicus DSM 15285 TaxID=1123350 RepID=A0A1M5QID6_9FIRM|nr:ATP-dependent helicase [Tepidibacter thalassicus]SHH13253.1 Superfamily I DNA or RNA helicase [Tepidibacter thalassicus DSM 15285]
MEANKEQQSIIEYYTKNHSEKRILLVEAPPGTGKTFTAVATAIEYTKKQLEINTKYNKKVLILTFSKNARAQIEKQLEQFSDNNINFQKFIEISNFHSFFQKYVWAYSKYLGLKEDLNILSPKQRKFMLSNEFIKIQAYDGDDKQYEWAESLLEGEFYPLTYKGNIKPSIKKLIPYKEELKDIIKNINKDGYIGFSDIGYYMNELLNKSELLLKTIQNKYNLIILDEYQDASDLQDKIVKKLIGKQNKAIFFADSKQMIYGWRGADSNRLLDLLKYYDLEIEQKSLKKSMRFKNHKDIENVLNLAREGKYNIYDFNSSSNIKYIKVEVNDKNLYSRQSKNQMYAALKYKIKNALPKYEDIQGKSVGILCRSNELVRYIKKSLREEFKITTYELNNNEEEHNIMGDLVKFFSKTDLNIDELTREMLKYIFAVIYDEKIGSIKKNKLNTIMYNNLKRARTPILKEFANLIEQAENTKEYKETLIKCIEIVKDNDLKVNYDMYSLLKRVLLCSSNKADNINNLFLQHQYLKAYKELKGIYVLNVHQSKGREFDYTYVIDRENIIKEDNLLYVALSRVKDKLVIFDWIMKK